MRGTAGHSGGRSTTPRHAISIIMTTEAPQRPRPARHRQPANRPCPGEKFTTPVATQGRPCPVLGILAKLDNNINRRQYTMFTSNTTTQ